uniref:RDD family protein n=1 Tax=Thaumasiovibrio occultus TaxID=1891184 RepID=UPI000B35B007|nr:RDD family protein [Thaumasiovibrio occultus]
MKEAGFFRRLAAWIYDLLLVAAILMLAGAVCVGVTALGANVGVVDLTGYVDVADYLNRNVAAATMMFSFLSFCVIFFYAYFWCLTGQTLGMKAWRLRLTNEKKERISITQALIRMATSVFGLGNLTCLIDVRNRSLQDHLADTHVWVEPKQAK